MPPFWENDPVVQGPAASPPPVQQPRAVPQPVFVAPDPQADYDRGRDTRTDNRSDENAARIAANDAERLRMEGERLAIAKAAADRAANPAASRPADPDRIPQIRTALDNIKRLRDMSGDNLAVGTWSTRFKDWPVLGQNRANVEGALQMVQGDLIQQQIARLSELNGGKGVASIANSETEAARMASSIANLSPEQDMANFRIGLDRAEQYYKRQLAGIEGADISDPAVRQRYGIGGAGDAPNAAPDGTRTPEMVGGVPKGTQVEFGMDAAGASDAEFDRNRFLMDRYGITPNQEASVIAFWNSNQGNAGLTADGARRFYASIGAPVPTDADLQKSIDDAKSGASFGGYDTSRAEQDWNDKIQARAAQMDENLGEVSNTGLAGQGLMAGLGDESAGIGEALGAALTGDFDLAKNYRFGNAVADYRYDQARERGGATGTAAELLGNAASLGIGTASTTPRTASQIVATGALGGAVPGFGYGEGLGDSLLGAGIGAGLGAGIGKVIAGRQGSVRVPTEGTRVIQAADDLNANFGTNIQPMPADVAGPGIRNLTGGAAKFPLAAAPIVNAGKAVNAESEAALGAISRTVGTPQELEVAGSQALSGARDWMKRTGTKVGTLYTRARNLSEGVEVPLTNARRVLDDHIAELEATPGGAKAVGDLRALSAEMDGNYTVDAIKRMRTTLRDRFMGDGIRATDIERRVGQVVDAAENDVAAGLIAAGKPEAAAAWRAASSEAAQRFQVIDDVIGRVIGKKGSEPRSGEQIMRNLATMSKTDSGRLRTFMDALPATEAGNVRATVIQRLGTKNADGTDFTLGKFLTEWDNMEPAAKRTMFGGELGTALDNLATVAKGSKEAGRFANFSNTGSPIGIGATGLGLTGYAVAPITTTLGLASQYGMGRLLASPGFARWLARMPKNPAALGNHIQGLAKIAGAESAIAQDALGLQRTLSQAFQGGSGRVSVQAVPLAAQAPPQSEDTTKTVAAPK